MRLCARCAAEHVDDGVVAVVLLVEAGNLELRDAVQLLQVLRERRLDGVLIDIVLQQLVLQLPEERRAVLLQLRLDPVLRPEKHLAVRLPDPVLAHPRPPLPRAVAVIAVGVDRPPRAPGP